MLDNLSTLINSMSEQDKALFESLMQALKDANGELSDLSAEHQQALSQLAQKYNPELQASQAQRAASEQYSQAVADFETTAAVTEAPVEPVVHEYDDKIKVLDSAFGQLVISIVDEALCQGGASRADAIRYAFYNKFLPEKLKNRDYCETLYYRYDDEIQAALGKIEQQTKSKPSQDPLLAIGLAWFSFIYQAYQEIEAKGDLADPE
jgi:hypothetical protein